MSKSSSRSYPSRAEELEGVLDRRTPTPKGHTLTRGQVAYRVKAVRQSVKMTQKEFARAAGVSRMTVCRWESGAMVPSRRTRELLEIKFALPERYLSTEKPVEDLDLKGLRLMPGRIVDFQNRNYVGLTDEQEARYSEAVVSWHQYLKEKDKLNLCNNVPTFLRWLMLTGRWK